MKSRTDSLVQLRTEDLVNLYDISIEPRLGAPGNGNHSPAEGRRGTGREGNVAPLAANISKTERCCLAEEVTDSQVTIFLRAA